MRGKKVCNFVYFFTYVEVQFVYMNGGQICTCIEYVVRWQSLLSMTIAFQITQLTLLFMYF